MISIAYSPLTTRLKKEARKLFIAKDISLLGSKSYSQPRYRKELETDYELLLTVCTFFEQPPILRRFL